MAAGNIRIGIGGWTFPPWRGEFYPPKLPQSKELEFAVRAMTAIEINATFYGRQKPKSWETWGSIAPEGFQYAVKASRFCVMRARLAEGQEGIANFFAQGLSALGSKLGPILWQFAPRRQFDRDDIAAFIDLLPDKVDGLKLRHALEPRHESFRDDRFFELCRSRDIAVVLEDSDEYPAIDVDTASFSYARFQRMREELTMGYDDDSLDAFAERARRAQTAGRDCYVFMINGAKVRAPAAAVALQQRLGIAQP